MAAMTGSREPPASPFHHEDFMTGPDTSLIARAEALDGFIKMQQAANNAAMRRDAAPPYNSTGVNNRRTQGGCFCFGNGDTPARARPDGRRNEPQRPARGYFPDNLSVQPERHPWTKHMEWSILACIDLLEENGLDEKNIFAVSAVEDLVKELHVPLHTALPRNTDPNVAAGAIKDRIRHATEPLVPKDCLKAYIESQGGVDPKQKEQLECTTFQDTQLSKTIEMIKVLVSPRRAFIFARLMRLFGRVSANVENSKMNEHSIAKCVAPSMLHWDPNSGYALLMLGKITGYVMAMITEARRFDEVLCQTISALGRQPNA